MSVISVIGKNSNTARYLRKQLILQNTDDTWRFFAHDEVDENAMAISQSDTVLNLAVHPRIMSEGLLDEETNLDRKLARLIEGSSAHYIMASSRKVYGDNPDGVNVTMDTPIIPDDTYGHAKAEIEKQLAEILPANRLSVIRFTNIVGFNDLNQQGLIGAVFRRFAYDLPVSIDLDCDCPRDFLPQREFAETVIAFARNPTAGTFNLGTGVGVALKEVMQGWANIFNGQVSYAPKKPETGFVLDSSDIRSAVGLPALDHDTVMRSLMDEGRSAQRYAHAGVHELIT